MNLLNAILHPGSKTGKYHLTLKESAKTPHLRLVFREGAVSTIKQAKGWKTDAEMAHYLGITRAYVRMLAKRRCSVSHNVMLRLAYLMNNLDKWYHFYEIIDPGDPVDPNHPLWNQEKYEGTIPYKKNSLSADFRKKDYPAETAP